MTFSDPVRNQNLSLKIIDNKLMQQANMLAFDHVFMLIALCFMLAVPMVLLLRSRGT